MRINKGTYLIIILLLACTPGMAQNAGPFIMTPIAITSGSVSLVATPIVMQGNSKCLSIATGGIRVLETKMNASGKFGASCEEVAPVATPLITLTSLNLSVYPNPTQSTTKLKIEGQFDVNLSARVGIMSMDGKPMMSQMVSMKDLKAGYTLNVASYAAGVYVVTVDFKNEHYPIKLIKL